MQDCSRSKCLQTASYPNPPSYTNKSLLTLILQFFRQLQSTYIPYSRLQNICQSFGIHVFGSPPLLLRFRIDGREAAIAVAVCFSAIIAASLDWDIGCGIDSVGSSRVEDTDRPLEACDRPRSNDSAIRQYDFMARLPNVEYRHDPKEPPRARPYHFVVFRTHVNYLFPYSAGSEEYTTFYGPQPPPRRPPRGYPFPPLPTVDLPPSHPAIEQLHGWHETALHLDALANPSRRRRRTARKGIGAERRYRTSDALMLSEFRLRMVVALRKAGEEVREQARGVLSMSGVIGRKRKRGSHECSRRCKIHCC